MASRPKKHGTPFLFFEEDANVFKRLKTAISINKKPGDNNEEEETHVVSLVPARETTPQRYDHTNLQDLYFELKRYSRSYGYYRYFHIHNSSRDNRRGRYNYFDSSSRKKKEDKQKDVVAVLKDFDIKELNKQLGDKEDVNEQYWKEKGDLSGFKNQTKKLNDIISSLQAEEEEKDKSANPLNNLKNLKILQKLKNKVVMSNLLGKVTKEKKDLEENEEQVELSEEDKKKMLASQNISLKSFIGSNLKNKLNNIQDLLKGSKKYQDAKKEVKNGKYTDFMFAPKGDSIYGFGDRNDYSQRECDEFEWKRAREVFGDGDIHVYKDIEPDDILQGGLGNCYFLSAISAIAEHHNRITKIFLTKEYNSEGIYVVAMCIAGIWQEIVIDDLIPCKPGTNKPAFNTSRSNELWVILLEKAWAKIHGGYLNIASGLTREALRDLTGASAKTFFTSRDKEELWTKLLEAEKKKFIMTAGSDELNNGSDAFIEKIGLAGSHAYSLLGVYELEYKRGLYKLLNPDDDTRYKKVERIVKLRNPWGEGEWSGDWSDNSPLWNEELKKALDFVQKEDGTFYMTFKDYCKYFSDCQICYYHDGYKYSAINKSSATNDTVYFRFSVGTEGEYYFSINQKNKRMFPKSMKYRYSPLSFMIGKIDEANNYFLYQGGSMKADKENWFSKTIPPGEYIAVVKTPWRSFVNEFSLSVYGPSATDIKEVQLSSFGKAVIPSMMKSHALSDDSIQYNSFSGQGHSNIKYKLFDNSAGFGYIFFKNDSDSNQLDATVEFRGSYNIELCDPFDGLRPSLSVLPKDSKIVAFEAQGLPYSSQMRLLSQFKKKEDDEMVKEKVKKSEIFIKRKEGNKEFNIKVMFDKTTEDLNILYSNETGDSTLREAIEFQLDNCYIEGRYGSYVEIICRPKSDELIEIHREDKSKDFNVSVKKLWYDVY